MLERCEAANGGRPITFFEITTAAAFLALAETPADWCLLEVGLGGRLDATNVIARPRLTVITPVSLDHQQYLGETLAEIAGEKAGILKPGVPCVARPAGPGGLDGDRGRGPRRSARRWCRGPGLAGLGGARPHGLPGRGGLARPAAAEPARRAPGRERRHGARRAARSSALGEAACAAAVTRAEWPARLQRLRRGPLVAAAGACELWLDGGHNPAAGEALAEALTRLPARPLHLVAGMLRTKDVAGFLRPLAARPRSLHRRQHPRRGRDADGGGDRRRRPRGRPARRDGRDLDAAVARDRRRRARQPAS